MENTPGTKIVEKQSVQRETLTISNGQEWKIGQLVQCDVTIETGGKLTVEQASQNNLTVKSGAELIIEQSAENSIEIKEGGVVKISDQAFKCDISIEAGGEIVIENAVQNSIDAKEGAIFSITGQDAENLIVGAPKSEHPKTEAGTEGGGLYPEDFNERFDEIIKEWVDKVLGLNQQLLERVELAVASTERIFNNEALLNAAQEGVIPKESFDRARGLVNSYRDGFCTVFFPELVDFVEEGKLTFEKLQRIVADRKKYDTYLHTGDIKDIQSDPNKIIMSLSRYEKADGSFDKNDMINVLSVMSEIVYLNKIRKDRGLDK